MACLPEASLVKGIAWYLNQLVVMILLQGMQKEGQTRTGYRRCWYDAETKLSGSICIMLLPDAWQPPESCGCCLV